MHANFFSANPLDRIAALRDDEDAIQGLLQRQDGVFLPVWRDQHLMQADGQIHTAMPSRAELGATAGLIEEHPWVLLGILGGKPVFALDLSSLEDVAPLLAHGSFEPLRPLAALLPASEAGMLAQARGMLHWRRNHRFCGFCGGPTAPEQGGARLVCRQCSLQHFPRTDPVAIMLVHCEGRALLARGTRFPTRRLFSALAGFIEPGESAEEAVAREVFEETGISLGRIRYHSSQTWPFPNSLMLGFLAEANGMELRLDPGEIAEAHWLTPAQLRTPEALDIELPGPIAIARSLLDAWLATQ